MVTTPRETPQIQPAAKESESNAATERSRHRPRTHQRAAGAGRAHGGGNGGRRRKESKMQQSGHGGEGGERGKARNVERRRIREAVRGRGRDKSTAARRQGGTEAASGARQAGLPVADEPALYARQAGARAIHPPSLRALLRALDYAHARAFIENGPADEKWTERARTGSSTRTWGVGSVGSRASCVGDGCLRFLPRFVADDVGAIRLNAGPSTRRFPLSFCSGWSRGACHDRPCPHTPGRRWGRTPSRRYPAGIRGTQIFCPVHVQIANFTPKVPSNQNMVIWVF